jgi:hypothetical protein
MVARMLDGDGENALYLLGGERCPLGAIAGDFDFGQFFKGVQGQMPLVNHPHPKGLQCDVIPLAGHGGLVT